VASLAKDDEIVTASGVHGRIVMVEADTVQLEVADRVRIVIDKSTVAKRKGPAPVPATEATPASSKT
jgi:preprotein translocase YajC subunit